MRIFGKVCALVLAALLVLQAIYAFGGRPVGGITGGIEFIALALCFVEDGIFNFRK